MRGTTEGLNLLAAILGENLLRPGDEILLTQAEHHANIVPWQFAAKKSGAAIRFELESTVRPSFAFYNTRAEADALVDALRRISQGR